jgi:hypothetical protein
MSLKNNEPKDNNFFKPEHISIRNQLRTLQGSEGMPNGP